MASINKLSIRGVRAFNPEDVEQCVEFYCPITIIVGSNGCGKTTIIESIKYAITGAFPPGCGRTGAYFVHDCKAVNQTTVKAQVKLRFTSRSAQQMVVVRSMELTQKKTTSTFKQLDGVLRMIDPDTGKKVSLSHKCTELDKQLPQLLGVSRAILEHVVFCHQEESSWPLMEGAVLKKRFDDIFDSTKYTKALHVFRQTEKDFLSKAKDLKADMAAFAAHKQAAQGFRKEYEEQVEALESIEETKQEVSQKIDKIKARTEDLGAIIDKVGDTEYQIGEHKNRLEKEKLLIKQRRTLVEKNLTTEHSLTDLKEMFSDFRSKMNEQNRKKDDLEDEAKRLEKEIEDGRDREKQLSSELGRLAAEKDAHERCLRERYNKMESIAQKYEMDLTSMSQSQSQGASFIAASLSQSMLEGDDNETFVTISAEDMQSFFRSLSAKEEELRSVLKETQDRNEAESDQILAAITELGGKIQAIENDKIRLNGERRTHQQELKALNDQLSSMSRVRKTDLDDTRKMAVRLAQERDNAQNDGRISQIKMEIRSIEDKLAHLRSRRDDDRSLLAALKQTTEAQNALVALQEECGKDFGDLEESLQDDAYSFTKFNISVPASLPNEGDDQGKELATLIDDMADAARSKHDAANNRFRSIAEDTANAQRMVSEKTALLANNQRSLTQVKSKLQGATGGVEKVRRTLDALRKHEEELGEATVPASVTEEAPREVLQFINERIEAVDQAAINSVYQPVIVKKIFRKLRKMAKQRGTSCPCCNREMDGNELQVFAQEMTSLEERFADVDPDAEAHSERVKSMYKSMRETVEGAMEDLNDHRRLSSEEADLEKVISKLQEEIGRHATILKECKDSKDETQSEVDELRLLIDTTRRLSDDAGRIARKKLSILQKRLDISASSGVNTSRDMRTVERDLNSIQDEYEKLQNKHTELNKESTDINMVISNKTTAASNAERSVRDKEEKFAAEMKASSRKQELQKRLQEITEEESELSNQMAPITVRLTKKEKERDRVRNLAKDEEHERTSHLNAFKNDVRVLQDIEQQIEKYETSSKPREHEMIVAKVSTIVARVDSKKTELDEIQPKLNDIRRAVEDQDRYKTNLQANIEILEAEENARVLQKEIVDLEVKRDAIEGSATAEEEFAALKERQDELMQKKARYDGMYSSHVEQIRALKRKLSGEDYKDVDEQFRVCMIKYTTTKAASEDLKKYATAMDKALLQFHGVKIKEINKIIRELWLLTYKGQDITNIEIQSGQEPGSKAAKSYNYRVVMSKGGAKLDMRGRCSAGQRVLASIVIRLALAETFGVNCGCIALDEPTVNLDYANKRGLALALAQIVASRANQRNFQLILITHDEDFVAMMKTELSTMTGFSMPENYFQVCREEGSDGKFYSKINVVDWEMLV